MTNKLKALDLFSGVGGNSLALFDMVETVAYCESDKHAAAVLLSRMEDGLLHNVPVFEDVCKLRGSDLPQVDIIIGGFPCQDISIVGKGAGLEGARSGLFYEIMRLADEIGPKYIFLENVPSIQTRGLDRVLKELSQRRYHAVWCNLSAKDIGAPHKRKRWFLLAYSQSLGAGVDERWVREVLEQGDLRSRGVQTGGNAGETQSEFCGVSDGTSGDVVESLPAYLKADFWKDEEPPRLTRDKDQRAQRIKRLGNGVVPLQARTAFLTLLGRMVI